MPPRAVLFIDGNNWYHSLRDVGVLSDRYRDPLSYVKISEKLVAPRTWTGTRYYIGALKDSHPGQADQQRFLSLMRNDDRRITTHLGRIEDQKKRNALADEILRLLGRWTVPPRDPPMDRDLVAALTALVDRHRYISVMKEKAADVLLAVDLCRMAFQDGYDVAYLLSADGDFTPAVEFVQATGRKVYVASPGTCYALGQIATYIHLRPDWFADCLADQAATP